MIKISIPIKVYYHKDVEKLERKRRLEIAAEHHVRESRSPLMNKVSYEFGARWMYRYLKKEGLLK